MNSKNSKASDLYRLLFNLSDKINLKRSDICVVLSNHDRYYPWKKQTKKQTKTKQNKKNLKNKSKTFKVSAPRRNEEFELLDVFYIRYSRLFWV